MRWWLEPELRIGEVEGAGPEVFGRIRNLIPDGDGGVWVYDVQAFQLKHFDAQGRHTVSVGSRGEGPGEFSGNACGHRGRNGEVWVETETVWHRFDGTGQLLGTFRTPSAMACAVRTWLPDGRYLVADGGFDRASGQLRSHFLVLEWADGSFDAVDTVPSPVVPPAETVTFVSVSGRSRSTDYVPFSHPPGFRLENGGWFWVWDGGGAYEIRLESLGGTTIRRVERAYVPARVPPDVRQQAIRDFLRPGWVPETEFDEAQVPVTYPPFSSVILAADESVWVQRALGETEVAWEVFDDQDQYLGAVELPESLKGLSIRQIGKDQLWGVLRDELDVEYVVRARIHRPAR